ncbi:MAG: hypothetical protein P1P85_02880 [Patescibacteria group bacterium]|nr:hypothetical protein [Patescibacteria group bacterium]
MQLDFIKQNQEKVFIFIGFFLILCVGFFSGYFYSQEQTGNRGLVFEETNQDCKDLIRSEVDSIKAVSVLKNSGDDNETSESSGMNESIGSFVASKNSKIYHKVDCAIVKRIKDENKIFFNSMKEAEDRGFKLHSGE